MKGCNRAAKLLGGLGRDDLDGVRGYGIMHVGTGKGTLNPAHFGAENGSDIRHFGRGFDTV